jgi:DNA repair photolyase
MTITESTIRSILTRASGYLRPVASHSLQPYRGCALGNSLCGVGCYMRHNEWVTRGEPWGSFVEVRTNAVDSYRGQYERERNWARRTRDDGRFGIFMSSATEPFQPVERTARVTRRLLETMVKRPPDFLIVQTHSHHVAEYLDLYPTLAARTELRFHVSIESDRDELPGLPRAASPVAKRIEAAAKLKAAGMRVFVTVSPLLPIDDPDAFFARVAQVADGVVIDHFVDGDGSPDGRRTRRTRLPLAMEQVNPLSTSIAYQDEIAAIARKHFPGRVGISVDGFAGRFS